MLQLGGNFDLSDESVTAEGDRQLGPRAGIHSGGQ
jgi:hypothetical protein